MLKLHLKDMDTVAALHTEKFNNLNVLLSVLKKKQEASFEYVKE
jgi:hypothetical protein